MKKIIYSIAIVINIFLLYFLFMKAYALPACRTDLEIHSHIYNIIKNDENKSEKSLNELSKYYIWFYKYNENLTSTNQQELKEILESYLKDKNKSMLIGIINDSKKCR